MTNNSLWWFSLLYRKVNCKFLFWFLYTRRNASVTKIRITCQAQPVYFALLCFNKVWSAQFLGPEKPYCMTAVKVMKNEEQMPSWKIRVPQDFLDPIKTVYLRGLHIAYLEALLYLVLFLGFRVDFFFHLCMIYKIALPWISLA